MEPTWRNRPERWGKYFFPGRLVFGENNFERSLCARVLDQDKVNLDIHHWSGVYFSAMSLFTSRLLFHCLLFHYVSHLFELRTRGLVVFDREVNQFVSSWFFLHWIMCVKFWIGERRNHAYVHWAIFLSYGSFQSKMKLGMVYIYCTATFSTPCIL